MQEHPNAFLGKMRLHKAGEHEAHWGKYFSLIISKCSWQLMCGTCWAA